MGERETLVEFVGRINGLMEEQEAMGEAISDERRMVTVAHGLRDPWKNIAVERMERMEGLTYTDLVQYLIMRQRGDDSIARSESAYITKGRGGRMVQGMGRGQRTGRGFRGGRATTYGRGGNLQQCYNCGDSGHWQSNCPQPVKCHRCGRVGHGSWNCQWRGRGVSGRRSANIAMVSHQEGATNEEESNVEDNQFVYMIGGQQKEGAGNYSFILDGAATSHVVGSHVILHDERPQVSKINGLGVSWSTGCGLLVVDGIEFRNTLRVPGIGANLISEGALQREGCHVIS
jgi:hypothetical protein